MRLVPVCLGLILVASACGEAADDLPAGSSATEPPAGPVVYAADDGLLRVEIYRSSDDTTFTCERRGPMELVLMPDGTGTFTYSNGVTVGVEEDGACEEGDGNQWPVVYDLVTKTFTIPPVAEGWDSWDIGGVYDSDIAQGSGGYVRTTDAPGDVLVRDTIELEFRLDRRSS